MIHQEIRFLCPYGEDPRKIIRARPELRLNGTGNILLSIAPREDKSRNLFHISLFR